MNKKDYAYNAITKGDLPFPKLAEDCQHDIGEYDQVKKWGNVTWYVCVNCGGVTREINDISESGMRRDRKIDYQTEHAGHPAGAKIEYGNSSPLGKDYERN